MKSLASIKEEIKEDTSNLDALIRAGLVNKAQLRRVHVILDKMTEAKPQFSTADKAIINNLLTKMVDLVTNDKQIFSRARQDLRKEEVDTEINVVEIPDDVEWTVDPIVEESMGSEFNPPTILILKRKAIRVYPNRTRVALYYNDKLHKYFSVPYSVGSDHIDDPLQSEEVEEVNEAVIDKLHDIVKNKQASTVKFGNGKTRTVDGFTASAVTQMHGALNDDNKKKYADMMHRSPEHFSKAAAFAFKHVK